MRLSPEACNRTFVRSRGLKGRHGGSLGYASEDAYCVMDAAIVAATPDGYRKR